MTDNDVIKALECCFTQKNCTECPLWREEFGTCLDKIAEAALHLINRQQAEIEKSNEEVKKLKTENKNLTSDLTTANAEIERLTHKNLSLDKECDNLFELMRIAKSEARKEFAERLYQSSSWLPLTAIPNRFVTVEQIKDLLKEMDGKENGND